MKYYTYIDTPIEPMRLASDGESLTEVYMTDQRYGLQAASDWVRQDDLPVLLEAKHQLAAYFAGELLDFDLPLAFEGTEFQRLVWGELQRIPYGITISYGEQALRMGMPNASRAVGMANGRNPFAVIVPCHRVIGANGKLTGYGGGLPRKQALLEFETRVRAGGPQPFANNDLILTAG